MVKNFQENSLKYHFFADFIHERLAVLTECGFNKLWVRNFILWTKGAFYESDREKKFLFANCFYIKMFMKFKIIFIKYQVTKLFTNRFALNNINSGTSLYPSDRWRLPTPISPVWRWVSYLVFCFLILLVWDDFSFYLHS